MLIYPVFIVLFNNYIEFRSEINGLNFYRCKIDIMNKRKLIIDGAIIVVILVLAVLLMNVLVRSMLKLTG